MQRARLQPMNDERAEQQRHHDVGRDAEGHERYEGPARGRIVGGFGAGDALDRPFAEALGRARHLLLHRVAGKGGDDRPAPRQDAEEEAEHGTAQDRPLRRRPIRARGPQSADASADHLAFEVLLEVGQDLGHTEQTHHDRHQADAVEKLEAAEGEPRLSRDLVHADQAQQDADGSHQQRLRHGPLAQKAQDGEAEYHQAEVFRRAEGDGHARERRRDQHQRDDGEGAGGE